MDTAAFGVGVLVGAFFVILILAEGLAYYTLRAAARQTHRQSVHNSAWPTQFGQAIYTPPPLPYEPPSQEFAADFRDSETRKELAPEHGPDFITLDEAVRGEWFLAMMARERCCNITRVPDGLSVDVCNTCGHFAGCIGGGELHPDTRPADPV